MPDFLDTITALTPRYGEAEARSIARILFEDALGIRHPGAQTALQPGQRVALEALMPRLLSGEPLQYALGTAHFYGLSLEVSPAVLIPRQETETLVYQAVQRLRQLGLDAPRVLDVGTGSGCIALAIQQQMPEALVVALDVCSDALDIARRNMLHTGCSIALLQADALRPETWPEGPFDLMVSNPPYVDPGEQHLMPDWVLQHEPHKALFAPPGDPLYFYRALQSMGRSLLRSGGWMLLEINEFRDRDIADAFSEAHWAAVQVMADLSGAPRVLQATLKSHPAEAPIG
jgi:release factor glutamine methyltransferase